MKNWLNSFDFQRGRDHEMGSYNDARKFCGLQPLPETFGDNTRPTEFSSDTWNRFSRLYEHPDDIELFPAGLSEISTENGKLGPTFSCIIGKQNRMIYHSKYVITKLTL